MKKILMVAVEAKPYATAGGTSAVVGTLSRVLCRQGYDVRLVLPYYSTLIRQPHYQVDYVMNLDVPVGRAPPPPLPEDWPDALRTYLRDYREPVPKAFVYQARPTTTDPDSDHVPLYLLGGDPYHYFPRVDGREVPIYPPLEEVGVDGGKLYTFFCRAVLQMSAQFCAQGWKADIIHCHDWPTGLIPVYLKQACPELAALEDTKTVLTIHNGSGVVYQGGWFGPELLYYAGLPQSLYDYGLAQHQHAVNLMKAGIIFADTVNDVVVNYDPIAGTGNGFDFIAPDHREMVEAIERAIRAYAALAHWKALVGNALQARDRHGHDFSWDTSAERYVETLYR